MIVAWLLYCAQQAKNIQLQKENELKDALIQIEMQNKVHFERMRISRDLHDNIGSQLTFIISALDNLMFQLKKENHSASEKISHINQFSRKTITELRDTIWAMNLEHISISDLQVRINNFVEQARISSPQIQFEMYFDENLEFDHEFTSFQAIHLYRVIQEAVNNAIKHANAGTIFLSFEKLDHQFTITIRDDGKGFSIEKNNHGNGLHNMKKRIEEIDGQFEIQSNSSGTTITIQLCIYQSIHFD